MQEVKEQAAADDGDKVEKLGHITSVGGEYQEEEDEEVDNGNNDEYDCQIQQLNGPADSGDQTWNYNQGHDLSDDSDQTISTYSQNNEPYLSSQMHPSIVSYCYCWLMLLFQ